MEQKTKRKSIFATVSELRHFYVDVTFIVVTIDILQNENNSLYIISRFIFLFKVKQRNQILLVLLFFNRHFTEYYIFSRAIFLFVWWAPVKLVTSTVF